jgi:hypothetical protein
LEAVNASKSATKGGRPRAKRRRELVSGERYSESRASNAKKDSSMEKLNTFEIDLLTRLSKAYPDLQLHISVLSVKSRELTGVGMYVNLEYENRIRIPSLDVSLSAISTSESILIPSLAYGLCYEVAITDGWLDFIEIVSYNEPWNGSLDGYSFEE